MLYRIEIDNFFSIGETQIVDLRARKSVEDSLGRLSPIYTGSEERAPNVVALFGPNAAGKSNILRAISFVVWFVTRSFENKPNQNLPYEKFGSKEKIGKPTRLSFTFSGPANFSGTFGEGPQCPYTYELVLSPRGSRTDSVDLERLSYRPKGVGKATTIIERSNGTSVKSAKGFMTASTENALNEVLRPQASVISTLAQLNHKVAGEFVSSVMAIVSNLFIDRIDNDERDMTHWYAANPAALQRLQEIANRIDLGIEKIDIDNTMTEPRLLFQHSGLDQIISLHRESHGTRQFIKVFPYIFMVLERGGIAIIDELDTAIHPLLLPEILRWFGDRTLNPHSAQIWTTCHSVSLLSELTKEEVIFCEKDSRGYTEVYNLADIDKVRRKENFFGNYMGGEYGAVPVVG
ncbi:MAG: AAA family ATPase [Hoeflea sp.]|uniref:AAA family ATPase n=1 Tax=Hoeflea sp. TaxID=1940281 RepID=UPI001D83FF23|nr:ATP-binding protein [Hoeflea sp.]MBU4528473.1 AAA family ATPase [Alphaproteobacteria bacterium]MBU4543142.1 AAA family ATPase [Alphaproteobacteria bacterium]MBU4551833.1 AAA family ATPase [Alphaproteobacteria bacterium]MBV1723728.1 AAA family ATPase [Hoeflea sp.]MBV1762044.1 AAA family ATPase [Hoeflea sp.]